MEDVAQDAYLSIVQNKKRIDDVYSSKTRHFVVTVIENISSPKRWDSNRKNGFYINSVGSENETKCSKHLTTEHALSINNFRRMPNDLFHYTRRNAGYD